MSKPTLNNRFLNKTIKVVHEARLNVIKSVNQIMVIAYFEIGKMIVEEEQSGLKRAVYGENLLHELSIALSAEFGRGFSIDNLENMRKFYNVYKISETPSRKSAKRISETVSRKSTKQKSETLSRKFQTPDFKLSWSHYVKLIRIADSNERRFYEIETFKNNWSVRELDRQINSALYTRLTLSRNKKEIKKLSAEGLILDNPRDLIKDPFFLEFLDLKEHSSFSENDLEQRIIDKLEQFLLELGNGFTFVARQKRISFDDKHFYIDLVFYNRILKCFLIIDLKIGELKHQDIGQMQMYVNFYDRKVKLEVEKTVAKLINRGTKQISSRSLRL